MNETLRLGTIAGVRVGVNWSVLVIVGLLVVGLAAGQFPLRYPGASTLAYGVAGTIGALVFVLSLLAHELAHAVVARRHGVEVEGITLWLLGGVARLQGEAGDPRAELQIAGIGPLVSLLLGAAFGAASWLLQGFGLEGLTVGVVQWLALINIVLAVFNLAPAAPLDGGRILRAVLWARHGDPVRAGIAASRAGRGFGTVIILGGLLLVLLGALGGLWFALIGWFITSAAGAEEQHHRARGWLDGLSVAEVMTPDPATVDHRHTVTELLEDHVLRTRHSAFPVTDDQGRPMGLVTLDRIRQLPADQRDVRRVADIARPIEEVPTAGPGDPVTGLLAAMAAGDGRVLVLDDGWVVGIVTPTDVTRAMELAALRRTS